jgi:hypothetical protein
VSSNSIPPYLRTTEPISFRQPTAPSTTANSAGAPLRSPAPVSTEGRSGVVKLPRLAKSECPTTGDRGAALTLVRLE